MKDRQQCQKMEELLLEDNRHITSEANIMRELTVFYLQLFAKDKGHEDVKAHARLQLLCHTKQTISNQDIQRLERKPSKSELWKIVRLMAKGKALGIDGLTIEVFLCCWSFLEDNVFAMLIFFWETRELYPSFNEGVLKLIPKKPDTRRNPN